MTHQELRIYSLSSADPITCVARSSTLPDELPFEPRNLLRNDTGSAKGCSAGSSLIPSTNDCAKVIKVLANSDSPFKLSRSDPTDIEFRSKMSRIRGIDGLQ